MSDGVPVTSPPEGWETQRQARHVDPDRARLVTSAPSRFTASTVGVTLSARYPDSLLDLDGADVPLRLVREPGNEHDPNAVAVNRADTDEHLGHLPRNLAARLAGPMDAGVGYVVTGYSVLVSWAGGIARPGLELDVERAIP